MNENIDQSNKCPLCSINKSSDLIEVMFSELSEKINENVVEPEKFKWLKCEDNSCEFWTREPKR
ncbi:MAG: hypothetical protein ACJ0DE_05020 [Dehalococcoidia bacterium]